jgi:hypothetical protein
VGMDVKVGEFRHDGYYDTFSVIPAKATLRSEIIEVRLR